MKIVIIATLFVCLVQSSYQQQSASGRAQADSPADQTYNFRYSTGNEGPAQIWREERREADGTIVGKYGYIDPNGEERIVEYRADPENFSASGAIGPDNAALRFSQAQQSSANRDASRAMNDWNRAAGRNAAIQAAPAAPAKPAISRQQAAPSWRPAAQAAPVDNENDAVVSSPAIPANWPPKIPTWENLPRQEQPNFAAPQQQQNNAPWTNTANTAQWNSAWQNFNWNENNRRVMSAVIPQVPAAPQQQFNNWNAQPVAQPAPVQPQPVAAPVQPASAPAGVSLGPNGAWNMFTEINHADGGLRRAQISPVAAVRNQQIASFPQVAAAPQQPQQQQQQQGIAPPPAWATSFNSNQGFARRSGSTRSNTQSRSQIRAPAAPTVVSQDPFSFSFGVDHS